MTSMHVCGRCDTFMKVALNGVRVREIKKDGSPYRMWAADLWRCPTCGWELITGFGTRALAHHGQPEYAALVDIAGRAGELVTAHHNRFHYDLGWDHARDAYGGYAEEEDR